MTSSELTYKVVFDLTRRTSHEVGSPFFIIVSNISVHDKLKELVKPYKQIYINKINDDFLL